MQQAVQGWRGFFAPSLAAGCYAFLLFDKFRVNLKDSSFWLNRVTLVSTQNSDCSVYINLSIKIMSCKYPPPFPFPMFWIRSLRFLILPHYYCVVINIKHFYSDSGPTPIFYWLHSSRL